MSFILDALKKSETDRQRQAHPETAYVPAASGHRSPGRWIWVVGILLAANMLALMYVLLRPDAPQQPAVATTPESAPQNAAGAIDDQRQAPAYTVEEPAGSPPDTAQEQAGAAPSSPTAGPAAPATVPAEPVDLPVEQAATSVDAPPAADFMTFSEARVAGMQVDDLALELHVFSSTAAERFVFINMGKYREGETLSEGPRVREIRQDGVLLEYSDMLFLLSRE